MSKPNGYELSRGWFDWAFENPSKVSPSHGILYFFCIEHCNRLGWKKEFGLPTTMAKEAIGIRSYNTYIKTLNDLIDWGFIILIEKSKNQYSSNIIALSNFNKAHNKALDKALIKHVTKQVQSTEQSIDSIDKQVNKITNKPINQQTIDVDFEKIFKSLFFIKVSQFFAQTIQTQKERVASIFAHKINQGAFEEFESQTNAYIDYKLKSKEKAHQWSSYLTSWEDSNWIDMLKNFEEKEKNSGNRKRLTLSMEDIMDVPMDYLNKKVGESDEDENNTQKRIG